MADKTEQRAGLRLRVVTPTGTALDEICDGVRLNAADGSVGVKKGHLPALILLSAGSVVTLRDGEPLCSLEIGGGFATVDNDTVTVLASGLLPESEQGDKF